MQKLYKRALILSILIYTIVWSAISLLRFYSFQAGYFDLGVAMGYAVYSVTNLKDIIQIITFKGIVYLVDPIAFAFSFQGLLVFQSFMLGLGAYPIYEISYMKLKKEVLAFLFAIGYLLYFPLAGVNWFDFHYQALFPSLFLLGYMLYLKGRKLASLAFLAVSATVHYPYTLFAFMFSLMLAFGKKRREDLKLWAPLLAFTAFIFAYNLLTKGAYGASLGTVAAPLVKPNFYDVLITIILIFLPLAFLPILSKWFIYIIPFIVMLLLTNYWGYVYPYVFKLQYGALYIPFVFLGTIEAVELLDRKNIITKKRATAMVYVSIVLFASIYQPYSPLNSYTEVNYNFKSIFSPNFTEYQQLMKILSLIPHGSEVLVSANDPEAFYPYYWLKPILSGSVTPEEVYNGSIKYIVAGPFGLAYIGIPQKPAVPMDYLVENASKRGFGVYAEAYGIMLLVYGYNGSIKYYYPLREYFPASGFVPTAPWFMKDGMIVATDAHSQLWFGPELLMPPGTYKITVFIKSTSNSSSNWLGIAVYADDQTKLITVYYINGASLKPGWNEVSFYFVVPAVYANEEVVGYAYKWEGTVYVKGIYINQTSYQA